MNTEATRLTNLSNKKEGARRRGAIETDGVYSLLGMTQDWIQRAMTIPLIVFDPASLDPVDSLVTEGGTDFLPDFSGVIGPE